MELSTLKYVYMLSGDDRERELALAEALVLTGGRTCAPKLVEADRRIDLARSGYVSCGIELLATGANLEETCRTLAEADIASEGFAVDIVRIPGGLKVKRHEIANALALVIRGRPDLDKPRERFLAFVTTERIWFGRMLDAPEPNWRRFRKKPFDCSSALPAQSARGVCNLLVRGGESVVDPCCGSGTLLIHAAALGARVTGFDINMKMVGATNKNLVHFGFGQCASVADAAEISGSYDLMLANIPYGNMSAISDEKARQIVANIVRLAPRGVIVAADDISGELTRSGARITQVIRLRKFSVTRLIFVYDRVEAGLAPRVSV